MKQLPFVCPHCSERLASVDLVLPNEDGHHFMVRPTRGSKCKFYKGRMANSCRGLGLTEDAALESWEGATAFIAIPVPLPQPPAAKAKEGKDEESYAKKES